MPLALTPDDIEQIREIVREEIARALGHSPPQQSASSEGDPLAGGRQFLAQMQALHNQRASQPIPGDPELDVFDAARLAGVTVDHVLSWVKAGHLTRKHENGKLMINREELETYLASLDETK